MKSIQYCFILLFVLLLVASCRKEQIPYDPILKTKIYKTRGDSFDKVNIWGHFISAPSHLSMKDSNHIGVIGTDTIYRKRWKLDDGYIMDIAVSDEDYFTDMTFSELVSYNEKYPDGFGYPLEKIYKRVVDKNPFLEFYVDEQNIFYKRDSIDIEQINRLIKQGTLGLHFTRTR